MKPSASASTTTRLTSLENGLEGLSKNLLSFVDESRAHREQQRQDNLQVWNALNEQSKRGQITWPMILTSLGVLVTVMGGVVSVARAFTDLQFKNQETVNRMHEWRLERVETAQDASNAHQAAASSGSTGFR